MAERVFARKLEKVGFEDVAVGNRIPFGIEQAALFPLFTPDLLAMMRRLIPSERHSCVATSVIVKAHKVE
jgi:arsenite methyltransferase